jgi:hypothetical protein
MISAPKSLNFLKQKQFMATIEAWEEMQAEGLEANAVPGTQWPRIPRVMAGFKAEIISKLAEIGPENQRKTRSAYCICVYIYKYK